jgi:hypothetical protein
VIDPTDIQPAQAVEFAVDRARPAERFARCGECSAPVDQDQRYCVGCGARQPGVRNPAVEYFAATATRRRTPLAQRRTGWASKAPGLALFFLALPLAVAIGVLAGRSGANDDKLIAALRAQKPIVVTATAGATGPTAATGPAPNPAAATAHGASRAGSASVRATASAPTSVSTRYGTVQRIAGSKVTAAQAEQGAAAVGAINKAVGQSYVNATQNLPGTVVVPATPGSSQP